MPTETENTTDRPARTARIEAHISRTQEQKNLLFNFRYQYYVVECGFFGDIADHPNMMFREPADDQGVNFHATCDGKVVGCARINRADDPGLAAYMELSGVENFMRDKGGESVFISRLIAKQPGSLFPIIEAVTRYVDQADVRFVFAGGAVPDISGMYRSVGFEMYLPGVPVLGFGTCDVYRLEIAMARKYNKWFRSFCGTERPGEPAAVA